MLKTQETRTQLQKWSLAHTFHRNSVWRVWYLWKLLDLDSNSKLSSVGFEQSLAARHVLGCQTACGSAWVDEVKPQPSRPAVPLSWKQNCYKHHKTCCFWEALAAWIMCELKLRVRLKTGKRFYLWWIIGLFISGIVPTAKAWFIIKVKPGLASALHSL